MPLLRFVHAADLHLDSPFKGLREASPEHVAAELYEATFRAYNNIIDLCIEEGVDALLVAGDIYDGADRSLRAQLKFVEGLKRLDEKGIRSFVCHGNHDPLDGWEARLDYPALCHRFGSEWGRVPVFLDDPGRAVVYGISYPKREVKDNLVDRLGDVETGPFSIGLLHANVGSDTGHEPYAPCTVDDLRQSGVHYWALGHVHARGHLNQHDPVVAYPGNPQGRHANETGPRGVYLVEVEDGGESHWDFRPVDVLRWEVCQLDIAGLETVHALLSSLNDLADGVLAEADDRPVVARVLLTGRGPMHRELRQPGVVNDLWEQLNARYVHMHPWLWCERIQVDTAAPINRDSVVQREDFIGDLARLVAEMRASPENLTELRELLMELFDDNRARHHLLGLLPVDEDLLRLLDAAESECLNLLIADEDEA